MATTEEWRETAEARLRLCQQQELDLGVLREKVTELLRWKLEAMKVMSGIDIQAVGQALTLKLGADIGPAILPGILALKALKARIEHLETALLGKIE